LFPLIYFIEHSPTTSDLVCAIQDLDRPTDIQWLGYGPLGRSILFASLMRVRSIRTRHKKLLRFSFTNTLPKSGQQEKCH